MSTYQQYNRFASPAEDGQRQEEQQGHNTDAPCEAEDAEKSLKKHAIKLYGFGITECVMGSITVILGIVTIIIGSMNSYPSAMVGPLFCYTSQGIWGGMFLLSCGILGILTKAFPSACIYNANMAISIVTSVIQCVAIVLSALAIPASVVTSNLFIHIVILVIQFASMIICIIHSAFCCAGVCHDRKMRVGVVQVPQQFVQLPNGQYSNVFGNSAVIIRHPSSAQTHQAVIAGYIPNVLDFSANTQYPCTQVRPQNVLLVTPQQEPLQSSHSSHCSPSSEPSETVPSRQNQATPPSENTADQREISGQ